MKTENQLKSNIQLFAEDSEDSEKTQQQDAISETMIALQNKYEEEHKLRLKAEEDIAQLSKVIRTMQIQPAEKDKEISLSDAVNKLFG